MIIVLEIFSRHLDDLREGFLDEEGFALDRKRYVPLDTVLGTNAIPAEVAAKLNKVIEQLVSKGEIDKTKRWQALDKILSVHLSQ